MRTIKLLVPMGLVVVMATALAVSTAAVGGRPLSATLTGAAEVPAGADPDGSGSAHVRVNPGLGEVCYSLQVADIEPALAAHIHVGVAGVNGGVVVTLEPPTDGSSAGCVGVDRGLAMALIRDPGGYYVNVHNAEYPGGAVRGQLGG